MISTFSQAVIMPGALRLVRVGGTPLGQRRVSRKVGYYALASGSWSTTGIGGGRKTDIASIFGARGRCDHMVRPKAGNQSAFQGTLAGTNELGRKSGAGLTVAPAQAVSVQMRFLGRTRPSRASMSS